MRTSRLLALGGVSLLAIGAVALVASSASADPGPEPNPPNPQPPGPADSLIGAYTYPPLTAFLHDPAWVADLEKAVGGRGIVGIAIRVTHEETIAGQKMLQGTLERVDTYRPGGGVDEGPPPAGVNRNTPLYSRASLGVGDVAWTPGVHRS